MTAKQRLAKKTLLTQSSHINNQETHSCKNKQQTII